MLASLARDEMEDSRTNLKHAVEQSLGGRRATGYVEVNRDDTVATTDDGVRVYGWKDRQVSD